MTDIVGIIGPGGEGGTFLDWSLHYLIGNTSSKMVLVDRIKNTVHGTIDTKICDNPITMSGNAHKHKKTHPTDSTIQQCVDLLKTCSGSKIYTMYIVPSDDTYNTFESYQNFVRYSISKCTGLKFINIYYPDEPLEDLVQRIYTKIPDKKESLDTIRARVKIECNKPDKIVINPNVYSLNIKDMFYNLDTEIYKILYWLNLTPKDDIYQSWLVTYKEWQLAQNFDVSYSI
jgi:hypothetical protein